METSRVFVSHTADMARFPLDRSFVRAALDAVARAGMVPVDMRYFEVDGFFKQIVELAACAVARFACVHVQQASQESL